jgi:hypothetical protein
VWTPQAHERFRTHHRCEVVGVLVDEARRHDVAFRATCDDQNITGTRRCQCDAYAFGFGGHAKLSRQTLDLARSVLKKEVPTWKQELRGLKQELQTKNEELPGLKQVLQTKNA